MDENPELTMPYRLISQQFIQDHLVMKIEAKDIDVALAEIKEENPDNSVVHVAEESKPDEDIYFVRVS